ncbi:MAG: CBS domain-containing protein [Bryobacteraceae bacterium]
MVHVRNILHGRELFSVASDETVAGVARRMAEMKVGAILVLRGTELEGLFSERDLMTRVVVQQRNPATTLVGAVMTTNLTTVSEDAPLEEALELMHAHNCRHLPVMRGRHVVGFLSMRDLMHFELERKTEELHQMRQYIHGSA